jgi:hypothetical protein
MAVAVALARANALTGMSRKQIAHAHPVGICCRAVCWPGVPAALPASAAEHVRHLAVHARQCLLALASQASLAVHALRTAHKN